jgi:hypothetical protein
MCDVMSDVPSSYDLIVGDIHYSPSPFAKKISFVLNDSELQEATHSQFERFWRVWYTDRHKYAPHLESFTLFLRPSYDAATNAIGTSGINAFLEYFRDHMESRGEKNHLVVYLDTYTEINNGTSHMIYDAPVKMLEVRVPARPIVPPAHPDYAPVVLSWAL